MVDLSVQGQAVKKEDPTNEYAKPKKTSLRKVDLDHLNISQGDSFGQILELKQKTLQLSQASPYGQVVETYGAQQQLPVPHQKEQMLNILT